MASPFAFTGKHLLDPDLLDLQDDGTCGTCEKGEGGKSVE